MMSLRKCSIACSASFALASDEFRLAVSVLGEVGGDGVLEEVLGSVFNQCCIGK